MKSTEAIALIYGLLVYFRALFHIHNYNSWTLMVIILLLPVAMIGIYIYYLDIKNFISECVKKRKLKTKL